MESSVITPEDVLESLMNDGTIDAIRLKIITQLKANLEYHLETLSCSTNIHPDVEFHPDTACHVHAVENASIQARPNMLQEELKNNTIKMVEQSKVLNTPGAEKQTKRELFDALRQELETPVLEKASKSVWELILDQHGLGKEISEIVEKVFCQLSGREPPLFPPSSSEAQPEKEREDTPTSSSKKRNFSEMSKEYVDEVTQVSADEPVAPQNINMLPSPN